MIGDKITINGQEYEEISEEEWSIINTNAICRMIMYDKDLYYKKVKKPAFPTTFEDDNWKFKVYHNSIEMFYKHDDSDYFLQDSISLPFLIEAIDYYKANQDVKE